MSEEPKAFWTFDGTTLQEWTVVSRTARTCRVRSMNPYTPNWLRTVMAATIGKVFHLSPELAMAARIAEIEAEIAHLSQRLRLRRSALETYQALLQTCERATDAESAVDPVGASEGKESLRAPESSSSEPLS